MRPWYLGNTTVRSPFRLRDGLIAISTSPIQGDLRGPEQETALRNLLGEKGIVELGEDTSYSVGRKWRSALSNLGFLYPKIPNSAGFPQSDIGQVDTITPNGWRLIRGSTVPAMQECFLRALMAYDIPSVLETAYEYTVFSPLQHTLSIMLELEKVTGDSKIHFIEMALVVQLSCSSDDRKAVVDRIIDLRNRREKSANKRQFDKSERDKAAIEHGYAETTFTDYADTNIRYLKATGLIHASGRGIACVPEKKLFLERLIQEHKPAESSREYLMALCEGARLPTDDQKSALLVLQDLLDQLARCGIAFELTGRSTETPADIAIIRHEIESILAQRNEEEYAERQHGEWSEIAAYMTLIVNRKSSATLPNGDEITIPKAETAAYLEWVLWRSFLAIDSLVNKPYHARRFNIDQDFLPIGTAPGNGPDMIFEFEDFVIVVEVTLTSNSRQEAAEGEPVRRHVADLVEFYQAQSGKPVYGLFIANQIDSNTAETFRIGVWYTRADDKMRLNIIPLTLERFKGLFEALFQSKGIDVGLIRNILEERGSVRGAHEAPSWKLAISSVVDKNLAKLFGSI